MPEHRFVVAEPYSPLRRTVLRYRLSGGTAWDRFEVIRTMRVAFGNEYLVRSFPFAEFTPAVRSIWPRRRVRDILLPVLSFLPPTDGATDEEAAERRTRIRRVEDGA